MVDNNPGRRILALLIGIALLLVAPANGQPTGEVPNLAGSDSTLSKRQK